MKKNSSYTCDRCGAEFDTDKVPYGKLDYSYNVKVNDYERRYSITGDFSEIHLCPKCAALFNTILGLYGFKQLKNRWWDNDTISLEK